MSIFDEFSGEEKAQFFKFLVIGGAALALAMQAVPFLGLGRFIMWLAEMSPFLAFGAYVVIWRIFYLLIAGACGGVVIVVTRILANTNVTVERVGVFTASVLTALFFGGEKLVAKLLGLLMHPVRWLGEAAYDEIQARCGLAMQKWREAQELRRLYREEFRGEFRSFRDFRRHFEGSGNESADNSANEKNEREQTQQREREAPKADPFQSACRLLGLSDDGKFSEGELKERFRKLMKGIHPDVAGPNELATQVNTACSLIKKRKGW